MYRVPFNQPCLSGDEFRQMRKAIELKHISGDGRFTRLSQEWLRRMLDVPAVLLTTSCTSALEMTALLLGVGPGDEVIFPSFTFVSTANAFVLRGARPVFVDVRPDTLNIDESLLERRITPRTRAIVVVHYAGVGCEMDAILKIARRRGIPVVEDNAHGLFGEYRGRRLGTLGTMGVLSFHETKNITCGEGGALILNDAKYLRRAEIIREKGTDRSRFLRGEVDKYTWRDLGSSYVPSDLLAAFLYAQLRASARIQEKRRRLWDAYWAAFAPWASDFGVRLPVVPAECSQGYHMFHMLMPSAGHRRSLIERLKSRGILGLFHYLPLHLSPMGRRAGGKRGDCPVAEDVSGRLLRLPFYTGMLRRDQLRVVREVKDFARRRWH